MPRLYILLRLLFVISLVFLRFTVARETEILSTLFALVIFVASTFYKSYPLVKHVHVLHIHRYGGTVCTAYICCYLEISSDALKRKRKKR